MVQVTEMNNQGKVFALSLPPIHAYVSIIFSSLFLFLRFEFVRNLFSAFVERDCKLIGSILSSSLISFFSLSPNSFCHTPPDKNHQRWRLVIELFHWVSLQMDERKEVSTLQFTESHAIPSQSLDRNSSADDERKQPTDAES